MTTDADNYPKWQSKSVPIEAQELEYKFIMYDDHGNVDWEHGDNRRVDLTSINGAKVVIEDEGWNQRNNQPKVIVQDGPGAIAG